MQFTSIVGFSTKETPLTLEWAEKNFDLLYRGDYEKPFLINKQADCYLIWNMDEDSVFWKLYLHYAVFDVEYIEEFEWICKSFGVETTIEQEMSIFVTRKVTTKTPITRELIKDKFNVSVSYGTIGNIEYLINKDLNMWLSFRIEGDEERTYIYCNNTSTRMRVNYIEEIKWAINKLKSIKSWKN